MRTNDFRLFDYTVSTYGEDGIAIYTPCRDRLEYNMKDGYGTALEIMTDKLTKLLRKDSDMTNIEVTKGSDYVQVDFGSGVVLTETDRGTEYSATIKYNNKVVLCTVLEGWRFSDAVSAAKRVLSLSKSPHDSHMISWSMSEYLGEGSALGVAYSLNGEYLTIPGRNVPVNPMTRDRSGEPDLIAFKYNGCTYVVQDDRTDLDISRRIFNYMIENGLLPEDTDTYQIYLSNNIPLYSVGNLEYVLPVPGDKVHIRKTSNNNELELSVADQRIIIPMQEFISEPELHITKLLCKYYSDTDLIIDRLVFRDNTVNMELSITKKYNGVQVTLTNYYGRPGISLTESIMTDVTVNYYESELATTSSLDSRIKLVRLADEVSSIMTILDRISQ